MGEKDFASVNKADPHALALRAHDIAVCLERTSAPDLENLQLLGMAVRLSLHLRGVPATDYMLIRDVCIHILDIPVMAVKSVLELLADAEFVNLVTDGKTIKSVVPDVPYFDTLYQKLGEFTLGSTTLTEPEQVCTALLNRLAGSPCLKDHAMDLGAEPDLVNRIIDIGTDGKFISARQARGRTILISPAYFPDNPAAYADLVAAQGAGTVKRVLELLQQNPGWPLKLIKDNKAIGGIQLSEKDIVVAEMLGADGFTSVPAITTDHLGTNYFLFAPRPGAPRLPSFKKQVYEKAMALISAMRQGQLLPESYAIRSPLAVLRSLRSTKSLRSNTEAIHQYRALCTMGVGRLVKTTGSFFRFELIDLPENIEALDLAMNIFSGTEAPPVVNDEVVLALRAGHQQLDSLLGRKRLLAESVIAPDPETLEAIDDHLLRGGR